MKEATGEVSMTVITIVLIGLILSVATVLVSDGKIKQWITDAFEKNTNINTNVNTNTNNNGISGQ